MAYFEIENFNKSFGEAQVLKGIQLSIEKGEVVSIIGSSGSGKTTLLRCINFLEKPDNGRMTLDGEVLFDARFKAKDSDRALRDKRLNFGLVFQSFNLFPQYTVFENITLAPTLLLKEEIKAQKKALKANGTLTAKERKEKLLAFKEERKNALIKDGGHHSHAKQPPNL